MAKRFMLICVIVLLISVHLDIEYACGEEDCSTSSSQALSTERVQGFTERVIHTAGEVVGFVTLGVLSFFLGHPRGLLSG